MIKGYIFDLDGVITDTAEFHYRAWARLAQEQSISFTREDNEALRGVPRRASLEILLKGKLYPEEQMLEMMERKNNYYRDFLTEIQPADLLVGVSDFLHEAHAAGIKIGLGSASKNARDVCEKLQIMALLDVLGDGASVVNQKPAPDLFIWVAGGMGFNPTECIVFEDAEAGVKAARDGGFWTVGLGPYERVRQAHRVRANLDGATVAEFERIGG